jgi:hypothetical protein
MDEGVGDASFMDDVVKVGNGWATRHPVKAASSRATLAPERAG